MNTPFKIGQYTFLKNRDILVKIVNITSTTIDYKLVKEDGSLSELIIIDPYQYAIKNLLHTKSIMTTLKEVKLRYPEYFI